MDEPDFTFVSISKQDNSEYIPRGCVEYDCNNSKRGIALLFTQTAIPGQMEIDIAVPDRDRLKKNLISFGFDVRTFDELNYSDIIEVLKSVAKEDHSDNDCLWVYHMGHGFKGKLMSQDKTFPVNELWEPFLGTNCPSLQNKPKLFFIQACRGNAGDPGAKYLRNGSVVNVDSNSIAETVSIPTTADLLVVYSSYEGYSSYYNYRGGFIIQALCEILKNIKENTEFYQILTAVNRKVAYDYVYDPPFSDTRKQMPTILSTLTKLFYLQKKN